MAEHPKDHTGHNNFCNLSPKGVKVWRNIPRTTPDTTTFGNPSPKGLKVWRNIPRTTPDTTTFAIYHLKAYSCGVKHIKDHTGHNNFCKLSPKGLKVWRNIPRTTPDTTTFAIYHLKAYSCGVTSQGPHRTQQLLQCIA